jgi:hypothetical protein
MTLEIGTLVSLESTLSRLPPALCSGASLQRGMAEPRTAAEVARDLADVLERRGLPYAVGGALALGFYATPRATIDVDVNVFVSPVADLQRALSALGEAGFVADDAAHVLADQAKTEGQFRGKVAGLRVDVFVPAIPYYAELEGRRRQVALLGRPLWILSAEDLLVLKMMFFRRKDLADVEAVLREQGALLDRQFVRQKLVDLSGELDERIAAWDQLDSDVPAS